MEDSKRCPKCGEVKPVGEFNRNNRRAGGLQVYCRSCQRDYFVERHSPEERREIRLKRRYGITTEGYGALLSSQDSRCRVCGKHNDDEVKCLHVDHDHATGKIRGLLCSNCNMAIGLLGDSPETVMNAYEYLLHNGESADAVLGILDDATVPTSANAYVLGEHKPLTETGAA